MGDPDSLILSTTSGSASTPTLIDYTNRFFGIMSDDGSAFSDVVITHSGVDTIVIHGFDNVEAFSSVIPEPSSFVLLGIGVVVGLTTFIRSAMRETRRAGEEATRIAATLKHEQEQGEPPRDDWTGDEPPDEDAS